MAAFTSSSAKHSAMVFTFLKAASLAPVVSKYMAWFTLLRGEISTACLLITPADPILVASSLGPLQANSHFLLRSVKESVEERPIEYCSH